MCTANNNCLQGPGTDIGLIFSLVVTIILVGIFGSNLASLQSVCDLFFFADECNQAHYTLYNRADFVGLIFMVSRLSVKTMKIGPLENF